MTRLHQWKYGTAAFMAMAVTTSAISPLFNLAPANAQYIGQNRTGQYGNATIPSGVALPVTYEKETITIAPGESKSITLRIANDIIDRNRNVLIPAGTKVHGRLESVDLDSYSRDTINTDDNQGKGVRFVAQELEFSNGQRQSINATSRTYSTTQKVTQGPSTNQVLTDAAIGGGVGILGSLVTGNRRIDDLKPVLGAAAGAGASVLLRKKEVNAFVLRPEQDLKITLNSNLNLVPSSRY